MECTCGASKYCTCRATSGTLVVTATAGTMGTGITSGDTITTTGSTWTNGPGSAWITAGGTSIISDDIEETTDDGPFIWCQPGVAESVYSFDTFVEAFEDAQAYAFRNNTDVYIAMREEVAMRLVWRESSRFRFDVNGVLRASADPEQEKMEQAKSRVPCPRCLNKQTLSQHEREFAFWCRLCGHHVSGDTVFTALRNLA